MGLSVFLALGRRLVRFRHVTKPFGEILVPRPRPPGSRSSRLRDSDGETDNLDGLWPRERLIKMDAAFVEAMRTAGAHGSTTAHHPPERSRERVVEVKGETGPFSDFLKTR